MEALGLVFSSCSLDLSKSIASDPHQDGILGLYSRNFQLESQNSPSQPSRFPARTSSERLIKSSNDPIRHARGTNEGCPAASTDHQRDRDFERLCKEGKLKKALDMLFWIEHDDVLPSQSLYWTFFKSCSKKKALLEVKRVRVHLAYHGLESTCFSADCLVSTLIKCGVVSEALQVFHSLHHRSTFSWTTLIASYADCGKGLEALYLYRSMQEEGVKPDEFTLVSVIKACGDLDEGKALHEATK